MLPFGLSVVPFNPPHKQLFIHRVFIIYSIRFLQVKIHEWQPHVKPLHDQNLMVLPLKRVTIVSEHIHLHGNEVCDTSFWNFEVINGPDMTKYRRTESDLTARATQGESFANVILWAEIKFDGCEICYINDPITKKDDLDSKKIYIYTLKYLVYMAQTALRVKAPTAGERLNSLITDIVENIYP